MRARSEGFTLNTIEKVKLLDDANIPNNCDNLDGIVKMTNHLQQTIKITDMHPTSNNQSIPFEPPKYTESKKEYIGGNDSGIKFHERGRIATFDKKIYGVLQTSKPEMNLHNFINTFDNEEELSEVSLENLLGIDNEKIGDIKMKIITLIEFFEKYEPQDQESMDNKEKLVELLMKKRDEIANTEDMIANITVNIDKVKKICYGNKTIKVVFN